MSWPMIRMLGDCWFGSTMGDAFQRNERFAPSVTTRVSRSRTGSPSRARARSRLTCSRSLAGTQRWRNSLPMTTFLGSP